MDKPTKDLINSYVENKRLAGLKEKQLKKKKSGLTALFNYLKLKATIIVEEDLKKYLSMKEQTISNKTYNDYITLIKDFYNYLKLEEVILLSPARKLERKKRQTENHLGVFTEDEVKRIIESIPDSVYGKRDRAIIELLYSTGMRIRELVMLNIDDINFREREVYIYNGKGDTERVVPVGRVALDVLEEYYFVRNFFVDESTFETDSLFFTKFKQRILPDSITRLINIYKKKAGVTSKGSAHALRHSMSTHMLKNGASLKQISEILGHKNLKSTQIYTHIETEDLKRKIKRCKKRSKNILNMER